MDLAIRLVLPSPSTKRWDEKIGNEKERMN